MKAAHSYGGIVLHDVINLRHAEKAAEQGVDGLILVCAGAGGHAGMLSPFALVTEVRAVFRADHPVRRRSRNGASDPGGAGHGRRPRLYGHALHRDARGQCAAGYKQMLVDSAARGHRLHLAVQRRAGNYLGPSVRLPVSIPTICRRRQDQDEFRRGRRNSTAKVWRDIWGAGQGVGSIDDLPGVAELVTRLEAEYRAARAVLA